MALESSMLNDISSKVGRLEVMQETNTKAIGEMASSVQRLVDKLEKSDDVAKEALQSSKSAHHRLDRIDKLVFWLGTTFFGAILIAIATYLIKGGFAPK